MVNPEMHAIESKVAGLTIETEYDSLNLEQTTKLRSINLERYKSCGVSKAILNRVEHDGPPTIEAGDTPKGSSITWAESTSDTSALHRHTVEAAWEALKGSIVHFRGQPIGTLAAVDESQAELNYDQVFMRDFVPSALAFLMKDEPLIVKNFLLETARLQSREKMVDLFKLGQGVMPASFKVHHPHPTIETLLPDFGEIAIGRVAPVDSGLWWIFLLNAYTTYTEDKSLSESPHCQRAMRLILKLWLSEGSDTSTALLCSDGCSMIYHRMGIYGYPLEIQALVFMALRYMSNLLLKDSDDYFFRYQISKRIKALSYHLQSYYWLDFQRLNDIYRYKTEEYSETALNKFNVIPESIPDWIFDSMPSCGGYFIGNVSPARMDFRWFCLGKFIGIMSSPATGKQVEPILDRVEERWEELIGGMPLKICYPGVKNQEGQRVTGCLPKNGGTNDDLLSRRKGLVKSAATYSGRSVTGNAKTMKKSCRSAPRWSVIHLATVLLIFLSTACMASATGQRCEVASLATNIRLFCSSNNPSSLCCEAVNAAMGSPDGKICLCLVGESPEILTMGFSSQNLIRLQNLCQQYDEEFDCDQSNTTELNHERTGIRESADEHRPKDSDRTRVRGSVARHHGDKEPPHHREGHRTKDSDRTGARDSVAREHSDEESPHHGNHRPKTPKSNLKDRKSRSKETSSKEDEQQKAVHSDQRPQQHDHTDPHTSGIIGFLSGFIVLLVSAMVIVVVVLKYKRQRIDFRQLLSVALAAALAQVPSQEALAAQRPFPVQGPPPPIDRAETVNGVPVLQVQVPPPLAIFPGPLEIVSMLGCIMVDRMRHRLWT